VLTELIYLNGGEPDVTRVGEYTPCDNKWGRLGLQPDEAFMLVHLFSFLRGILFAVGDSEAEFDVLNFIQRDVQHEASGSKVFLPTGFEVQRFG
jgi:hypothetical protein